MFNSSHFILLSLAAVVLVSGCIGGGFNPEAIARTSPIVSSFLEEHPNAEVRITHFTADQAANIIEDIRADCDNSQAEAKEFYRVTVEDPSTSLSAVAWIDVENRIVECALKKGVEIGTACNSGEVRECTKRGDEGIQSCIEGEWGECEVERDEDNETGTCTETDGGLDFLNFGVVEGVHEGEEFRHADECKSDLELKEWHCTVDDHNISRAGHEDVECSDLGNYVCIGGECVLAGNETFCGDGVCNGNETNVTCPQDCGEGNETEDTCFETDDGLDYFNYGIVEGFEDGEAFRNVDECDNDHDLREWSCDVDSNNETEPEHETVDCRDLGNYTCLEGACVLAGNETFCGDGVCNGNETNVTCPQDCGGNQTFECNDGFDNDGDGLEDYPADLGCSNSTDDDETNCGDGICEGGETNVTCPQDCGGNQTDTTAPNITLSIIPQNVSVGHNVTINVTALDSSGMDFVNISIDNITIQNCSGDGQESMNCLYIYFASNSTIGLHSVLVKVFDIFSNMAVEDGSFFVY